MTRFLILCRYFSPENKIGSVRPSKIAKYLAKTNEYKNMIQALEDLNNRISDINQSRNIVPNLLNQIMFLQIFQNKKHPRGCFLYAG